MADHTPPRFTPPRRSERELKTISSAPRWIYREAAAGFDLSTHEFAVLVTIADNLDHRGVATVATLLIAERTGMGRNVAARAIDTLVRLHLLYELDPRAKGRIMRYSIPLEIPWYPR